MKPNDIHSELSSVAAETMMSTVAMDLQPVTLMASEQFLQHHSLVRRLEKQHIELIERTLVDPIDLILDDRVCMTIRSTAVLTSQEAARALVSHVQALISFETCWLVLTVEAVEPR
jgi:hypothetical protein